MKTVTICGSMKFETEMQRIAFLLETKHNMNVLQCVYNVYNQRRRDETERIGKKVKINWISICKTNIKKWGI